MSKQQDQNNRFDENFESVTVRHEQTESNRSRFIEGVVHLSEAKREFQLRQKEWTDCEAEVLRLSKHNQELKESMMKSLLNKEEKLGKKFSIEEAIRSLNQNIEELDASLDLYLNNDVVDSICERYSTANQTSLVNKIQDARYKLNQMQ